MTKDVIDKNFAVINADDFYNGFTNACRFFK